LRTATRRRPSRLTPLACALSLTVAPAGLRAQAAPSAPAASTTAAAKKLPLAAAEQPDLSTSGALYDELARMDSILFDAAFVACDAQKTSSLFTDDVEFYHDRTGFESGQQVRETFQRLTRSCPRDRGITRELVEGSLQVYPMKDYGAVQMGVHRFVERGAPTSTVAKFVHLWQKKDGAWRISRVLSFDHRDAKPR
jgi:hypothetical protein